nr:BNR-4 repeat-containing protein [uncultured Shewanella sp.]
MLIRFFIFFTFTISLSLINACDSVDQANYLNVPSGVYEHCIDVTVDHGSYVVVNNKTEQSRNVEICENSNVKIYNSNDRVTQERFYFFDVNMSNKSVIKDAMTLWYNNPSFYSDGATLYIGFVDSVGNVKIAKYDEGKSLEIVNVHSFNSSDDHSAPVITINESGQIVLLFSHHSSSLYYAVSNRAHNIDSFNVRILDSGYITYPSIFKFPNNELVGFFRKGFSGDYSKGEYHKIKSYDGGLTWSSSSPVIAFDKKFITYVLPRLIDGKIYLAFSQLDRTDSIYKDVYLTISDDRGDSWSTKNGTNILVDEDNALLLVKQENLRVSDITTNFGKTLIAYSHFEYDNEFSCCLKGNEIFIHVLEDARSYFIGKGIINYYSDGLVFDSNYPSLSYYFANETSGLNSKLILVENVLGKSTNFRTLVGLPINGVNNMRITSLPNNMPLALMWLTASKYESYNKFYSDIIFSGY